MKQPEAILNCVICNHPFDWNNLEYCPNCNWQQIDYIGDVEHTAVLLRPEREAWVAKKNYKISDFSYEGYIPALVEAMKKIVINQITYDRSFIPNFERDPFETPEEFNLRLKQQPAFLGIAHLDAKKYDVRQERFDLTIEWHHAEYMPMVFKLLDSKASYYLNMNRDQAKHLFQKDNQRMIFGSFQLEKPELNDDIIFSNTPVLVGDDCIFELKSNQEFKQKISSDSPTSNDELNRNKIYTIRIPDLSKYSDSKATLGHITKWFVNVGEYISKNTAVAEIYCNNKEILLVSVRSGKLSKILIPAKEFVLSGDVVAQIEVDD